VVENGAGFDIDGTDSDCCLALEAEMGGLVCQVFVELPVGCQQDFEHYLMDLNKVLKKSLVK